MLHSVRLLLRIIKWHLIHQSNRSGAVLRNQESVIQFVPSLGEEGFYNLKNNL